MESRIHIVCPVCDEDDYKVLYEPWVREDSPEVLYGTALGGRGTQRLVRCRSCGFIYENPRYSEEVIIAGYSLASGEKHDSQFSMRQISFRRTLQSIAKSLPGPGSRILDIGTAGGAFLAAAAELGYEAFGLEPSADLVRSAKKRGLRVEIGTLDRNPYQGETFDIVSLWDVLEHLCEPKRVLRHISGLIKPTGVLIVNFPELETLPGKILGRRMWWIQSVHIQHFNKSSIGKILNLTGFQAFQFQRFWQTLELGHLGRMAESLGLPFVGSIRKFIPPSIMQIPIRYYAAQTTVLARPSAAVKSAKVVPTKIEPVLAT